MSEILVASDPDDLALFEEARRVAEALAESGDGERSDDGADGADDRRDRPSVVAVAFDGLADPASFAAGPDEVVRVVPKGTAGAGGKESGDEAAADAAAVGDGDASDGAAFAAGAAGVRSRASALAAVARDAADVRAVLLPDTPDGADLAAATARRLRAGCVTDCLLRVRDGELSAGRPAYNGRAYAEVSFERGPPVATLNREALGAPSEPATEAPDVRTLEVDVDADDRIRHVETFDVPERDLAKARRIVAGGYGLGGPDGFEVVDDLADALGAAVGASRPPADEDWVAYDRQIGVTGKEIDVELYVPCAISGDSYHMRSVNAEYLIPINSDPEARIFNFADIGIVGDFYEYAPALAEAVRRAKREAEDASAVADGGSGESGDETVGADGAESDAARSNDERTEETE